MTVVVPKMCWYQTAGSLVSGHAIDLSSLRPHEGACQWWTATFQLDVYVFCNTDVQLYISSEYSSCLPQNMPRGSLATRTCPIVPGRFAKLPLASGLSRLAQSAGALRPGNATVIQIDWPLTTVCSQQTTILISHDQPICSFQTIFNSKTQWFWWV